MEKPDSFAESSNSKETSTTNQSAPHAQGPIFPWFDLPKELRLHVLSFTELVVREHPHHVVPDVRIRDGKILSNVRSAATAILFATKYADEKAAREATCRFNKGPDCDCTNTPNAILAVRNKLFHDEALETLLSRNRLVFEPQKPKHILAWLEAQGPAIRKIRQVDIQFMFVDKKQPTLNGCRDWHKKSGTQYRGWAKLAKYMRDNLWLAKLDLCINAALDLDILSEFNIEHLIDDHCCEMKECYRKMVKPLYKLGPKKGLKSFQAFFSCHFEEEIKAVKRVMGNGYEPTCTDPHRNGWYPHGFASGCHLPPNEVVLLCNQRSARVCSGCGHVHTDDEFWEDEEEEGWFSDEYDSWDEEDYFAEEECEELYMQEMHAMGLDGSSFQDMQGPYVGYDPTDAPPPVD